MAVIAYKKFWSEFIDIYRSLPCMWNSKNENYNNRESRVLARHKLVEKLQEIEPDANHDTVKRKINTFRSNFNREVRKMRQAQVKQPPEVYNPTLWYFENLSFLLDQVKQNCNDESIDGHYNKFMSTLMGSTIAKSEMAENETMDAESIIQEGITDDDDQYSNYEELARKKSMSFSGIKSKELKSFIDPLQNESSTLAQEYINQSKVSSSPENDRTSHFEIEKKSTKSEEDSNTTSRLSIKKSKLHIRSQNPYKRHQFRHDVLSSMLTDEAAIYGQSWACGFRKLSSQQKLFAKKAIDEILILGQLNVLKLNMVPTSANVLDDTCD